MYYSDIVALLQEHYPILGVKINRDAPLESLCLMEEKVNIYKDDVLYIGHAAQVEHMAQLPRNFICAGRVDVQNAPKTTNIATIQQEDFYSAFNLAQQALNRSLRAEGAYAKMLRMILSGSGLSAVLSEAALQFGNALAILDVSGKILARSTPFNVPDPLWITSAQQGYCPADFMDHIKQVRAKKKIHLTTEAFDNVCESTGLTYVCSRILLREELVGYVFMFEGEKKSDAACYELLPIISKAASEVIQHYNSDIDLQTGLYRSILTDMLRGIEPVHADARIAASELKFPPRMRVMVVRTTYYHGENYIKGKLHQEMQRIFGKAPSVYHQKGIIQIVPLDKQLRISDKNLERVEALAESQQLVVGISNEFYRPSQFAQYYAQADETLRLAQRLGKSGRLHYYADLAFYALLNHFPAEQHLGRFCHPALGRLRKYDSENGTDLYDTLKVLTETGFNQKLTAERLFLHRNTLNYRKQRISELGEVDFNNPDTLFLLIYSFQIDGFLQNRLS